jgi:hypothetical protein
MTNAGRPAFASSVKASSCVAAASSAWVKASPIGLTFSARCSSCSRKKCRSTFSIRDRARRSVTDRGREVTLQGLQDLGMRSGASGIVLGNYLTTEGRNDADDFAMLDRLGFEVLA